MVRPEFGPFTDVTIENLEEATTAGLRLMMCRGTNLNYYKWLVTKTQRGSGYFAVTYWRYNRRAWADKRYEKVRKEVGHE